MNNIVFSRAAFALQQKLKAKAQAAASVFHRLPIRLEFPNCQQLHSASIRVVLYGKAWPDWTAGLSNKDLWREMIGVREVLWIADDSDALIPDPICPNSQTVIIPLTEESALNFPPIHASLAPNASSIETLRNKSAFSSYVSVNNLVQYCPATYNDADEAIFPCVVKSVNLQGGAGVAVAKNPKHLQSLLKRNPWNKGGVMLQALIPGTREFVTHCICRDGRILWNYSLAYEMLGVDDVRKGTLGYKIAEHSPSDHIILKFQEMLLPLGYSGPCNFNYKQLDNGQIAVFEINPRFGGSLMKPENIGHLREALSCIIANAH